MNTNTKDMVIEAMVADMGIWAYTVARRRAEAGRRVLEKRAGGGRGKVAARLITNNF